MLDWNEILLQRNVAQTHIHFELLHFVWIIYVIVSIVKQMFSLKLLSRS